MLDKAFERFPIVNGLVFHSDQGWQYQHAYYRNRLSKHGIIQSMSRKGNYYDNSIMETFFGSRKHFILFASYFFHHIKPPIPRVGIRGSSTQMVLSKMLAGIGLRRWSPRSKAPATYDGAHSIALLHSEQSQGQVLLSLR